MWPSLRFYFAVLCLFSACSGMKWNVFSTKTLYKWAVDVDKPVVPNADNVVALNNSLCQAIHVSGVFRHGARFPSDGSMEEIKDLHAKIVEAKSPSVFLGLNMWKNEYNMSLASELVTEGIAEQFGLGQRFVTRFYQMFNNLGNRVDFLSSRKSRSVDSSKYFYQGMADFLSGIGEYKNKVNDTLLRFYEDCEEFEEQEEETAGEFNKFDKTPEFRKVAEELRKRLGMADTLSSEMIYQLNELCSYETYVHRVEDSVWCRLLTDADREVLEYGQDIEKWYESSYGGELNTNLSCPLVKDILTRMERIANLNVTWDYNTPVNSSEYVSGRFYFGHSETVAQLITALGLFKDQQPLLASNMAAMKNRKFKSSDIFPFSANVAFALYSCDGMNKAMSEKQFVVKLFVNEKAAVIPACGEDQCMLEDVIQAYKPLIENCDLKALCDDDDDDGINSALTVEYNVVLPPLMLIISYLVMKRNTA